jgi:DNA-binding GntR family transcriptional regulator
VNRAFGAEETQIVKLVALPELRPLSLRHRSTRVLRTAIVEGHLKPRDRIVEEEVSERLGVNRGPVREGLRKLEQEGLVATCPYRGTEVLGVSYEEVEQVLVPLD